MNILVHRNVDIQNSFWIISEVELVRSLNELGHRAILVGMCMDNQGSPPAFIKLIKAPFGKSKLYRLKMFFLLPYLVLRENADVVIVDVMSVYSIISLAFVNFFIRKKIFIDVRTIPVENDSRLERTYFHYIKIFNKIISGGIFITEGVKDYFKQKYKYSCRINLIRPSGVNDKIFYSSNCNHVPDTYLNRVKNRFILFYHGSISEHRGVNLILDAVKNLKAEITNILFVSVSNNNQIIREYCRKNNYEIYDHLLLIEKVDHHLLPGYIAKADFCIVPLPRISWWEVSSPLKLFEYLAMEKPVILSDIQAHLDVVPVNAKYALYFNPDAPYDLTEKILIAYNRRTEFTPYLKSARELVSQKYSWDVQAKNLINFIEQI